MQCLCLCLCHFLCLWLWLAVEVSGEHHLRGKHHRGGPRRANGTHHEHALNYDYLQEKTALFDNLTAPLLPGLGVNATSALLIPSVLHIIHLREISSTTPKDLKYFVFLNLISAVGHLRPSTLFIYCIESQVPPSNLTSSHHQYKYWNLFLNMTRTHFSGTRVQLVHLDPARDFKIFGYDPWQLTFKSDVIRMKALLRHGGIYVDTDVLILNSLDKFRAHSPLVVGREEESELDFTLCNAIMLAAPSSTFLQRWYDSYLTLPYTLANKHDTPYRLVACNDCHSGRLAGRLSLLFPSEVEIISRHEFFDISFSDEKLLFGGESEEQWVANRAAAAAAAADSNSGGASQNSTASRRARLAIASMHFQHLWHSRPLNLKTLAQVDERYLCSSVSLYANMARLALAREPSGLRDYLLSTCGALVLDATLRDFGLGQ